MIFALVFSIMRTLVPQLSAMTLTVAQSQLIKPSEIVPARWLLGEAWALINGAWKRVDSSEVSNEGRELDENTFNMAFANILIPLPSAAFQRSDSAVSAATDSLCM
jgi:hypothetical protein